MTFDATDQHPGRHLEYVAIDVARLAAQLVHERIGTATATGTKSSPTDVVTETDTRSEALIRAELRSRCPGSTILGEELGDDIGHNNVQWIVDPIDGTVNFLYDLPVVSVSIAAEIDGITVAGAVVDVVRGETFSAALGTGARRDSVAITASAGVSLGRALVGTGFSYDSVRRAQQAAIVSRLLPMCRDIRCMGSAALNMCWVACGRLDAYYEHDTKTYDYAAGALIAAEASATVDLPSNNGLGFCLAAPCAIFDDLRELIVTP